MRRLESSELSQEKQTAHYGIYLTLQEVKVLDRALRHQNTMVSDPLSVDVPDNIRVGIALRAEKDASAKLTWPTGDLGTSFDGIAEAIVAYGVHLNAVSNTLPEDPFLGGELACAKGIYDIFSAEIEFDSMHNVWLGDTSQ